MPVRSSQSREKWMLEALRLARTPRELPYPNPWVGCVIIHRGRIVGRGSHHGPGTAHAEIEALRQAGKHAKGASMYVTLEPCCHYGRTPPCTDAILRAGVKKVFYALVDPSPLVSGRGASLLKSSGVKVARGICSRQAAALNEAYLKFRATGLPFVTVKIAATLDGKISTRTGQSKWITDARARRRARGLRAENQAVLVGINTVLADNPHLGPRLPPISRNSLRNNPFRIVLDSRLRIPAKSRVIRSGNSIVACADGASPRKIARLERFGATVWKFKGSRVPLQALLRKLSARGILSLLVEGGSEVLGSFFDQGLVDRVYWFLAPKVVGSTASRAAVAGKGVARISNAWKLTNPSLKRVGNSWLIQGNLSRWATADQNV
jgi:diaminohydroxyphosphoribosylaminopyrimidine deaminase / 5-amino-6-(5-phosphoribosylamino)uracil reductase